MKTDNTVYEIARHYVLDHAGDIPQDLFNLIHGALRARDLKTLCGLSSYLPTAQHGLETYRVIRQIEAFFKKNADFSDDTIGTNAAILGFLESEKKCASVNRRIHFFLDNSAVRSSWLGKAISAMSQDISNLLGTHDRFLSEIPTRIRVTSGATATRPRSSSRAYDKLARRVVACTPGAAPYLAALYRFYGYKRPKFEVTTQNRVALVPKNWKTKRTIACEPDGNVPLQLAFDSYVKDRLLKWGVDLSDQSRNQRYARSASISGSHATLDIASASDTVSQNLVAALLPDSWFAMLNAWRSSSWKYDELSGHYHKFSSMGNGCTFGLESLIFAAAARAVGSRDFCVYGDDIIIETELYEPLVTLLSALGFTTNSEKSFNQGPFRESCGVDAYLGTDITPFYVRTWNPKSGPEFSHNINGLISISLPGGALSNFLLRLLKKTPKVVYVPYNSDTTTGVFLPASSAYSKRLIRTRDSIPRFLGYSSKSKHEVIADSVSLALWFLQKGHHRTGKSVVESSRIPLLTHKYVKKWLNWQVPVTGTPSHLYWWADQIIALRP